MHWNNGKFHENITVGQTVYITDHKHIAISGGINFVEFGESVVNTNVKGNNITITANRKLSANASDGIEIIAKGGDMLIQSSQGEVNINADSNLNINANGYFNITAQNGITVNPKNYGTSLPNSGVTGQIFLKLLS